jgi:hypothetical protein
MYLDNSHNFHTVLHGNGIVQAELGSISGFEAQMSDRESFIPEHFGSARPRVGQTDPLRLSTHLQRGSGPRKLRDCN